MNPSRIIGSIIPHITSLDSGTGIGFRNSIGDGIPPRNIGIFVLSNIGASDFSNWSVLWNGAVKSEVEKLGNNSVFKNSEHDKILKLNIWAQKFCNFESC